MLEVLKPQHIDGEEVYTITTLGMSVEEIEAMRRAVRLAKVQEYVREFEERQQTPGQDVDINL